MYVHECSNTNRARCVLRMHLGCVVLYKVDILGEDSAWSAYNYIWIDIRCMLTVWLL